MGDDFTRNAAKSTYLLVALAAVIFLLVLPGFVLSIASNMTGVKMSIVKDDTPVPEHKVFDRRGRSDMTVWLRVPETTSEEDMAQITHHLINTGYPNRFAITYFVYLADDGEMNRQNSPSGKEADQIFEWTLKSGIRRVK